METPLSETIPLLLLFLVMMGGGAYFAAAETAFASASPIKLRTIANLAVEGRSSRDRRRAKQAASALFVLSHFDKALSTLLVGANIAQIAVASVSAVLVTRTLGVKFMAASTLFVTAVVFLFAEMIPKSFAADRPEGACLFFAPSMRVFMTVFTPVSALFGVITALLNRLCGSKKIPTVTEAELGALLQNAEAEKAASRKQEAGKPQESGLLHRAFRFDNYTTGEILTPLSCVVTIPENADRETVISVIKKSGFSRFPVADEKRNFVGVLSAQRYMKRLVSAGKADVKKVMYEPCFVQASTRIDDAARLMSASQMQMAIVLDEGAQTGIVTMDDVLARLV